MNSIGRWLRAGAALGLPLLIAACDGGGGGGQGGSGGAGAGGGQGGSGGAGGEGMSLLGCGLIQADCAPDDGAAVSADVGTWSACGAALDGAPLARFLMFPADIDGLAPGAKWTTAGGDLSIGWLPDGAAGMVTGASSGEISVVSAGSTIVEVEYTFETNDGVTYSGKATLTVCDSAPLCG